jgi:thiamine kinase-like enzyme
MNVYDRDDVILRLVPRLECLRGKRDISHLASGTFGTVCTLDKNHVAKIQLLSTPGRVHQFHNEVSNQSMFQPFAPVMTGHFIETVADNICGVIVMKRVRVLDDYLMIKRNARTLTGIIDSMVTGLEFLRDNAYTHGDLALFNIAITDQNTILFLDFDLSSTTLYHPMVDILRLITELYARYRSDNSRKMNPANMTYLRKHGIPKWADVYDIDAKQYTIAAISDMWSDAFETYTSPLLNPDAIERYRT